MTVRCTTCDALALADPAQKDRWIRFLEAQVERLLRQSVIDAGRATPQQQKEHKP